MCLIMKDLKAKLAKSVNPEHWEKMLSLESMPFDAPKSGRIAVRIVVEGGETLTATHDVPPVG